MRLDLLNNEIIVTVYFSLGLSSAVSFGCFLSNDVVLSCSEVDGDGEIGEHCACFVSSKQSIF